MPGRSIKPETSALRWSRDDLYVPFPCAVLYRCFAEDGTLLYAGISRNPIERWRNHARRKPWWGEVNVIEFETFETERAALTAELNAIRTEFPMFNVRGVIGAVA